MSPDTADPAASLTADEIARFGPDPLATFRANLAAIEGRIAAACARAGRDRSQVQLLPITKTVPAHVLRLAHAAGMRAFGENKVQEAAAKREALADLPVHWTIVGHLQTNKVRQLIPLADAFQALDSLRLAQMLQQRLDSEGRDLDVWVQVNTSAEDSKSGLAPDELLPFVEALQACPRLRPRGLMTLALPSNDPAKVRPCFALLRELRDRAARIDPRLTGLSMGMTGDMELAIEEGSTLVRVGQAIFGRRPGGAATG